MSFVTNEFELESASSAIIDETNSTTKDQKVYTTNAHKRKADQNTPEERAKTNERAAERKRNWRNSKTIEENAKMSELEAERLRNLRISKTIEERAKMNELEAERKRNRSNSKTPEERAKVNEFEDNSLASIIKISFVGAFTPLHHS